MTNNISLTIRLPHELNTNLQVAAKQLGLTKTNLIRSAIHDFLVDDKIVLDFTPKYMDAKDRMVLNVNQLTYDILESTCTKYGQSMNAVITVVSVLALERSSKWLQSIGK